MPRDHSYRHPPQAGLGMPRVDAWDKVQGGERYAADYYGAGVLWAGVKRAGVPHARLRAVHTRAASQVPGVVAVLTHREVGGSNRQGVVQKDQPVLVDERVRHCGDPLALVLAQSPGALARGLALVEAELEPLPGVFDPEKALEPGAPVLHPDHGQGNLLLAGCITRGEGKKALESCPVVVEAVYHLPRQEHAYLETEAGWARLQEDGHLVIVASTQTPFRDRAEVAQALGLEPERVRIIAPYPGGAFGGKDGVSLQSLLGLAALACPGRSVKMWLSREDSFLSSPKRHPARLRYRLGAQRDGTLEALEVDALYDTGPYDHLGGVVMTLGLEHAGGPYRIPHVHLQGRAVYTNNPVGGAFRGFGVPQVTAGMELSLELLARRLGLAPDELRRRNLLHRGQMTPVGVTLRGSVGLARCLERARAHPLWAGREAWKARAGSHKLRGVGLALAMHGVGYGPVVPDVANAKLRLTRRGSFRVYCGVVDMGQGNASTCLQLAGDVLNQDLGRLELILPDTERTLPSGSSSASRTTFTFGPALLAAARELKQRLQAKAADLFMCPAGETALAPGVVRHLPSGRQLPLEQLAAMMQREERTSLARHRAPVAPERPSADPALQLHGLPHCVFSFGAQVAAVEVDRLTGQVEVKGFLSVCDCGNVINPQLLEQQIQGGAAQGLGYALWEDFASHRGLALTPDLSTYIIPTALDLPDQECLVVPTFEPAGPLGLKGAGELPVDGPLPAVAAAVSEACGHHFTRFPLTPERVLAALEEQGED